MATKIPTTELKVGMFVADLGRQWFDTPCLLQGFLIEDDDQIRELRTHCEFVMVDRARSTGEQFAPVPASATNTIPPASARRAIAMPREVVKITSAAALPLEPGLERAQGAPGQAARLIPLEEVLARRAPVGAY